MRGGAGRPPSSPGAWCQHSSAVQRSLCPHQGGQLAVSQVALQCQVEAARQQAVHQRAQHSAVVARAGEALLQPGLAHAGHGARDGGACGQGRRREGRRRQRAAWHAAAAGEASPPGLDGQVGAHRAGKAGRAASPASPASPAAPAAPASPPDSSRSGCSTSSPCPWLSSTCRLPAESAPQWSNIRLTVSPGRSGASFQGGCSVATSSSPCARGVRGGGERAAVVRGA